MAKKYKMYTVKGCPACAKAKQYMKKNEVDYEEIDVNDDIDAIIKIIGKNKPVEIPILCTKNKCEIGFSKETYDKVVG